MNTDLDEPDEDLVDDVEEGTPLDEQPLGNTNAGPEERLGDTLSPNTDLGPIRMAIVIDGSKVTPYSKELGNRPVKVDVLNVSHIMAANRWSYEAALAHVEDVVQGYR